MRRSTRSSRSKLPFHLPPELISLVVDKIEDLPSLKACSLVNIAWSQRARDLLYRSIYLGNPKPKIRCKELKKIFAARPSIPANTHSLTIVEHSKNHKSAYADGWLKSCNEILDLLPLFTSVCHITLQCEPEFLNWRLVPPQLRIALFDLFERPHVMGIELVNIWSFQVTPFIHYHHLRELILENVGAELSDVEAFLPLNYVPRVPLDSEPLCGLRVFDVCASGAVLKVLFGALSSPNVADGTQMVLNPYKPKELWVKTLDFDEDMQEAWSLILDQCCSDVETFYITQEGRDPIDMSDAFASLPIFSFQRMPKLNKLFVNLSPYLLAAYDLTELEDAMINSLVSSSSQPNPSALREFTLEFDCRPTLDESRYPSFHLADDLEAYLDDNQLLSRLDLTLSNETAFPKLVVVSLGLDITFRTLPEEEWPIVKRSLELKLPRLKRRGVLKVFKHRQLEEIE